MKNPAVIFIVILVSSSFFCCDPGDATSVETNDSSFINPTYFVEFTGTVKDTNDQPVDSVAVHYEFSFDTHVLAKTSNTLPSSTISFSIPTAGKVLLLVLRYGTRELISVLVDTIQRAGNHSVIFDPKKAGNGVYIYQLTVENKITEKLMLIKGIPANDLINAKPIVTTRHDGSFKVPTSVFGVGVQTISTGEGSPEIIGYQKISDKIRLLFIKSGKIIGAQSVTVDTIKNQNIDFIIEK